MVQLGQVDICTKVSMMLSHVALPRKGYLEAVFHIFAYLKKHHVGTPGDMEIGRASGRGRV